MAVRIRMKRMGRRHRPFYRICVMDARKPRDGEAIEEVGTYDPMVREKSDRVKLKMDRVDYWLGVGATPSEKVGVLIKKVKDNRFGTVTAPPPLTPPKEPEPEPEAEAPAEETAEAPAEESAEATEGESAEQAEAPAEEAEEKPEASEE